MTGLEKHRFLGLSCVQREDVLRNMDSKQLLDVLKGKDFEGKRYVIDFAEKKGLVKPGEYNSICYPEKSHNPKKFFRKPKLYDYQKKFRL